MEDTILQVSLDQKRFNKLIAIMQYTQNQNPTLTTITPNLIIEMAIDIVHDKAFGDSDGE